MLDDGASDWLGSSGWLLLPHENGLAWLMTSTGDEWLHWQTPIDLRGATASTILSFQSWFVGDGFATVQVSSDGLNWQPVSAVPASDRWTSISVDLRSYIGSAIQIGFAWQDTNVDTRDQWAVDTILVAEELPTLSPPPIVSTSTPFSPTEAVTLATYVSTPTLQPSATLAEIMPTEETTALIVESVPTDLLTATETATSLPVITVTLFTQPTDAASLTATATETAQVSATEQPPRLSAACKFDVDMDGIVTEHDLSRIDEEILNTGVNETTAVYDLNANLQIDIGDLQLMAGYLYKTCDD